MRKLIFSSLLFLLIFAQPVFAAEVQLGPINTAQLAEIYKFYGYKGVRGYLMLPKYNYPRIILTQFPSDFDTIKDEEQQRSLFIKILTPMAMKLNQEILAERKKIEDINAAFEKNQELDKKQTEYIEKIAKTYDIFTRLQGYQRYKFLITELLERVDKIPPSFLVAVSAIETNWGNSRIIKEGNSLYKQLEWHTNKGLKPKDETQDDSYRIKTYPDLYSSMQEYALKLNSHVNFKAMRNFRNAQRYRGVPLRGTSFAYTLLTHTPLSNYAGMLEYTIAFYELNIIDKSALDDKITSKKLPTNIEKLLAKNKKKQQ